MFGCSGNSVRHSFTGFTWIQLLLLNHIFTIIIKLKLKSIKYNIILFIKLKIKCQTKNLKNMTIPVIEFIEQ